MPKLYGYILNQLLTATGLILTTLAAALWLTQSLRFLELAVNGGAGLAEFMTLVLFTLPKFLTVLLPIAAGIGVMFVYNKLLNDSELVVMRAVGVSQWSLAQPAMLMALGAMLVLLALHTYAQPLSKWQFHQQQEQLTAHFSDVLIRPGVFNSLGRDKTLYVRERLDRGEMRGIVFHDGADPTKPVTIMAERGVLREGNEGPQVVVYNGTRQEPTASPGKLQQLSFERYVIDLAVFNKKSGNERPDIGERTLWQLLFPEPDTSDEDRRRYLAEANAQLSLPLYGLAIPIVLLAVLLTGEFSRRGQARRVFGAVCVMVALESGSLGFSDLGLHGWWGLSAMYGFPLLSVLIALMILAGRPAWLFRRPPPPMEPDETGDTATSATARTAAGHSGFPGPALVSDVGPRPAYLGAPTIRLPRGSQDDDQER